MRYLVAIVLSLTFSLSAFGQDKSLSADQHALVETEREFARFCVENGIRAAWLEYFTDDGVIFMPGPVNAKETWGKRQPQTKPPRIVLEWEPRYGEVSQAGDIGYNIGPWNITDTGSPNEPPEHGYFLSMWRKQADGRWRVSLDFGSGRGAPATDDHVLGKPFDLAPQYKSKVPGKATAEAELATLMDLEKQFAQRAVSTGALNSYRSLFADYAKVMRPAQAPTTKKEIASFIPAGSDVALSFKPIGGEVAKSRDLGYTYGSYELRKGAEVKEKGFYAHVFKRNSSGKWQIVVTNIESVKE